MPDVRRLLILPLVVSLGLAACGDDSSSSTSTTQVEDSTSTEVSTPDSTSPTTPGLDPAFVELFQTQLEAVGCFSGEVDGIDGAVTTSAVIAFQRAKGLSDDGMVGPETEGALEAAVAAGETVCVARGGPTAGSEIDLVSSSLEASFALQSCENPDESTLGLVAENDASIVLTIDAANGSGTVTVRGGTEQDGLDLQGTITSITVGDTGDVTVNGTFAGSNEAFTVTGSCA